MTSTARKAAAQPAVPPAERHGYAVLAKGAALTPYTFTLGELAPGEVDIMVTVRTTAPPHSADSASRGHGDAILFWLLTEQL